MWSFIEGIIVSYNGNDFLVLGSRDNEEEVGKVFNYVKDSSNCFQIATYEVLNYLEVLEDYLYLDSDSVIITGLKQKGEEKLETTKKLLIPATILGTDGIEYNVTEITAYAFRDNKDIEKLEFESGSKLRRIDEYVFNGCSNISGEIVIPNSVTMIGQYAFGGCTLVEKLTLPGSVEALSCLVFDDWINTQIIYMQGRTEPPVTIDDYQGMGWSHGWKSGCDANIVWDN